MKDLISIIIVNWNGKNDTRECLASINKLESHNIQLLPIVVDNGSADGSVSVIRRTFPNVKVLENNRNLGFSGGNNVGIRYALSHHAQYIWILNNDTIVDKNALQPLVKHACNEDIGLIGSKIYFQKGFEFHKDRYTLKEQGTVIWYAGGIIDWNNVLASHYGIDQIDTGQYEQVKETDFVTGCSMFFRANIVDRVGMFNEKYYLYLEDVDFSVRIKRAGYRLLFVPQSRIWHKNSGSTDKPGHDLHQYYFTRNRLLFGYTYASIRTKAALFRESIRYMLFGPKVKRKASIDAYLGNFGEGYIWTKN